MSLPCKTKARDNGVTVHTEISTVNKKKVNLIGLNREELENAISSLGYENFRAKQIWHWIYHRGVTHFEQMTTLAKTVRKELDQYFDIQRPIIIREQLSSDKTRKWLLGPPGGGEIETVFIPENDRGALCISSQVGCALSCKFCNTGTQPLVRNLTPSDIVGQMLVARDTYGEWPSSEGRNLLSNIVMMGMGEPLLNFENVKRALRIIMDPEGIAVSKRRITLSTAGYVPLMERCGEEIGVNLAVSLHAVRNDLRDEIVPLNRKFPIDELLHACRAYPGVNNSRRITFEYIMLKGINDSEADAKELCRLIRGIPSKVNLIPFNTWPGAPYECSDENQIKKFAQIINAEGYSSPVRRPRGRDIYAACGQLKSDTERKVRARN